MARVGRPTDDPRGEILSIRVALRHKRLLERRAAAERITLSEALRRYLDELRSPPPSRQDSRALSKQTKPHT
jgi:hypothetical protein